MFQYLAEIYAGLTQKEEFPLQQRKNDASLPGEMNQKLDASPKRAEQEKEYKKPLTVSKMIEKFEGKEWGERGQIGHKWVTKNFVAERIREDTVRYRYPNGVWHEITDYPDGSSTTQSGSLGRGG